MTSTGFVLGRVFLWLDFLTIVRLLSSLSGSESSTTSLSLGVRTRVGVYLGNVIVV